MDITMGLQDLLLGAGKIKSTNTTDENLIDAYSIEGKYVSINQKGRFFLILILSIINLRI